MTTFSGTSEITESVDDENKQIEEYLQNRNVMKTGKRYYIKQDINRLFEAIEIKSSQKGSKDASQKSAMKRPIRPYSSSQAVNLKQALRGLCISHASEMAAMNKRLSRIGIVPFSPPGGCESMEVESEQYGVTKMGPELNCAVKTLDVVAKPDEGSSSKSSNEETCHLSRSNQSGHRPHMSKDMRWEAIRSVEKQHGYLGLRHFKFMKKVGGGDIGSVYLSELIGTGCLFALKIMDNEFLVSKRKTIRAQTERDILETLDHPFLPTLYAHFTTDKYACLVIDYCPGGDLHVLRQRQPNKTFSEHAVRFYVAEVLLALEYLHMLGIVYRDLKPENILVREDGHIMLLDFDLSFRCAANNDPKLLKSPSPLPEPSNRMSSPCSSHSRCLEQSFCLNPSWQVSCFTPKLKTAEFEAAQMTQLVVEPTSARSNSFVGTQEYLAPEIIKGEGHGSAVDWWTYGVFMYELLYGKTPFKGTTDEGTLVNVVSQSLKFPESPMISSNARDLIRRLLEKEPEKRLGYSKGASEIKSHSFFVGLNWALIRCESPPEIPRLSATTNNSQKKKQGEKEVTSNAEGIGFEIF
ncbi:unnamed protein product [Cuscuta epithymum]|uniref:non-specific serine/threonine protein kinase n=1 Tax=Cuscuta epithymum TaxID=186058 RepID=A0AAV0D6G8_9ASTE|nr:unnamed protein product [Cuscuta epithymum]